MRILEFMKRVAPALIISAIAGWATFSHIQTPNKLNTALTVVLISLSVVQLIIEKWPKDSQVVLMNDNSHEDSFNCPSYSFKYRFSVISSSEIMKDRKD